MSRGVRPWCSTMTSVVTMKPSNTVLIPAISTDSAVIGDATVRNNILLLIEQILAFMSLTRLDFLTKEQLSAMSACAVEIQRKCTTVLGDYGNQAIPKFHWLSHIADFVHTAGSVRSFSMQSFERRHSLVKGAVAHTNGKDWMPQTMSRLEESHFVNSVLPELLGMPIAASTLSADSEKDVIFLRGRRTDSTLSPTAFELLPDAWQVFVADVGRALPFDADIATWFNGARVRRIDEVDVVVKVGDSVEVLGVGCVPNQHLAGSFRVAGVEGFFHYNLDLALESGGAAGFAAVGPLVGSGEDAELTQCCMVVRYYRMSPSLLLSLRISHSR